MEICPLIYITYFWTWHCSTYKCVYNRLITTKYTQYTMKWKQSKAIFFSIYKMCVSATILFTTHHPRNWTQISWVEPTVLTTKQSPALILKFFHSIFASCLIRTITEDRPSCTARLPYCILTINQVFTHACGCLFGMETKIPLSFYPLTYSYNLCVHWTVLQYKCVQGVTWKFHNYQSHTNRITVKTYLML